MSAIVTPTAITTAPIKFTAPEKQRLSAAKAELARLDSLLVDVVRIKGVLDTAAEDFASGKISIREAIGLLGATGDSMARAEIERRLRRPLKTALRETVASVSDLIGKATAWHITELTAKARELEAGERAAIETLGMSQDDFVPSDLLLGLREQIRRAVADSAQPPGRDALNKLLVGIE